MLLWFSPRFCYWRTDNGWHCDFQLRLIWLITTPFDYRNNHSSLLWYLISQGSFSTWFGWLALQHLWWKHKLIWILLLIYVLIFFGSEFFLHTLDLSLSVMHYDFMKKMLVIIDLNLTKYWLRTIFLFCTLKVVY